MAESIDRFVRSMRAAGLAICLSFMVCNLVRMRNGEGGNQGKAYCSNSMIKLVAGMQKHGGARAKILACIC